MNLVAAGIVGATIGGGGATNYFGLVLSNRVTEDFGTVGGGHDNTSSGYGATVGGGHLNTSGADYTTVSGGRRNSSSGTFATVGGGAENTNSSYAGVRCNGLHGGPFNTFTEGINSANPNGGDIVMLRPSNYNERLTIHKPVTLRATREGPATIGR